MRCPKCSCENPPDARFCGACGGPLPPGGEPPVAETSVLPAPPVRELTAGTTFAGRYQVIEDLGKGGMGRVYKVFDAEVREKLALKLIKPEIARDAASIERFRDELKLARTISHRNICRMHDLGREQNTYYITMEYVSGEDLKSLIHRIGALPIAKAVSIARQVCDGLEEAHRVGVVHRDLKPQNIMIDREGNARIMDFGLARTVKRRRTSGARALIGTPAYMAPEQVDGKEAGPQSDLYSLGIVLFEMLTGRLPFEGDTALSIAVQQKTESVPDPRKINPQIPESLKQIVLKCLQKSREKRYPGARELAADLAKLQEALPAPSPLPLRESLTSKQITLRVPAKKIWIPAALALAALVALAVWQFRPQPASARRSLAVMAFRNQTGDSEYDYLQETIPNLLITSLEQSGHFRVTTMQRLKDLLRQSGKDAAAALDEEAGFDVCRREGIEALAVGFYTKAGNTFVTDVKVLDAATGQPLKTAQSRGEGPASILKTQIDEISRAVSRGAGLSALKVERPQPRIADLTTSSLEAYNLFLRGQDEYYRYFFAQAVRTLENAVERDTTFAVAWLYLSRARDRLGDFRAGDEALEKARQFAEKATEKERLYIEAHYASAIEQNEERRYRILQDLIRRYPAEKEAYYQLGQYYSGQGRYREGLNAFEQVLSLDPAFGPAVNQIAYSHSYLGEFQEAMTCFERYAALNPGDPNPKDSMAELYVTMGRLDDAVAAYRALLAEKPDFQISWAGLAYAYALQENYAEAERCAEEFANRAPSAGRALGAMWLRDYYAYLLGRWDRPLASFRAVRERAREEGEDYFAAAADWIIGFIECDRGEFEAARAAFQAYAAWEGRQSPSARERAAVDLAMLEAGVDVRQGRVDAARTAVQDVERRLPGLDAGDQEFTRYHAQLLAAEVALASNAVEEAIALGQKIIWPRFSTSDVGAVAGHNTPFLKDVLARAYWKKGDLDRAAAEYRKLTTISPDNQLRYLIHPLYHYRLGQVLEQQGEREPARVQYRKFLECWKDADPGHPELADARKRLAALR